MRNQIVSRETTTGLWCEARAHLSVVFDSNKIFLETINGVLIAICIFCTIRTFQKGVVILVTNPAVVCIQLRYEACNFFLVKATTAVLGKSTFTGHWFISRPVFLLSPLFTDTGKTVKNVHHRTCCNVIVFGWNAKAKGAYLRVTL